MTKKPEKFTKVTGLRKQGEELLRMTKRDVAAMPVRTCNGSCTNCRFITLKQR